MSTWSEFLTSIGYNGVLRTSDVTDYDGPQFACVTIPTDATLNQVLAAIADKICEVEASIVTPIDADDVVYNGTLIFPCFTLVGADVETIIEALATEVCTINATIPLDAGDLQRGPGVVYDGGVTPGLTTDPILGLFNDIMAEMGNMVTDIAAAVDEATLADFVGTYFRMSGFVYSGADATDAGLNVTIDDGGGGSSKFGIDGYVFTKASTVVTLTPTADNYLDISSAGTFTNTPVTIGNPAPPIASDSIRLYMFTTNALNVTVTVDMRNTYPIVDNAMLGDSVVETRNIDALAVTGAKLETIGAGATVGDTDLFQLVYDTKGRVTGATANYTIAGVAVGDILRYDGAGWVNWVNNFIDGSGTAGRVPYFTDANTVADSTIRDNGTVAAVNVAVNAARQFYVNATAVGVTHAGYYSVSGANATNIGLRGDASNGTSINLGLYGVAGAAIAFPKATGLAGVVGTAFPTAAIEGFAGFFVTDTDGAATADTFGVYIDGQNSGTGRAYGIVVENGKCLIGAAASTLDCGILEIVSTTQGVLFPRMTTAQKNAIAAPTGGLVVFDTDLDKLCVYGAAAWETITSV